MTDQLFEGMEPSWESPADVLKGDDLYRYHIDNAQEMFGQESMLAFQRYEKDHNWIALAEALWELFSSYIGLGSHQPQNGAPQRSPYADWIYKNMKKQGKSLLSFFFDSSFRMLDDLPREKACSELRSLRRRVESDRAVEAATSQGTSEAIQMYDFFLVKINSELSFHQDRTDEAPILALPEAQPVILEGKIQTSHELESLKLKDILTPDEAAFYVDLKKSYLYKLTSKGEIKYFKQGKFNRFYRTELDAWKKVNRRDMSSKTDIDSQAATYVVVKGDNNIIRGQRSSSKRKEYSNFEDFCYDKICMMKPADRKDFLDINQGESTFYAQSQDWLKEYNTTYDKHIKNFSSPISKAKKRYKDQH